MNIESMLFGGVRVGRDSSGNIRLSTTGLAVQTTADGKYVAYQGGDLIDATASTLADSDQFVFRIPRQFDELQPGDLIIQSDDPFRALFVQQPQPPNRVICLDPVLSQQVEYIPQRNARNERLVVRAESLAGGLAAAGGPGAALPVANMLAPNMMQYMLLSRSGGLAGSGDRLSTYITAATLAQQPVGVNDLVALDMMSEMGQDPLNAMILAQAIGGRNLANVGAAGPVDDPAVAADETIQAATRAAQARDAAEAARDAAKEAAAKDDAARRDEEISRADRASRIARRAEQQALRYAPVALAYGDADIADDVREALSVVTQAAEKAQQFRKEAEE